MGGHVDTVWTTEQSEALIAFIISGLSYSQAATALNDKFDTQFTRCAASGRGWRIGLTAPPKVKAPAKKRKRDRVPTIKPIPRMEAIRLRCTEIVPQNVTLLELDGCRYPSGDGPFTFCNHQQQPESSYCPAHEALCHATSPRLTDEERQIRRQRWKRLQKTLNTEAA